jgi:single-stranded DNA-binding protein
MEVKFVLFILTNKKGERTMTQYNRQFNNGNRQFNNNPNNGGNNMNQNQPDNRPFGNGQDVVPTHGIFENRGEFIGNVGSHKNNFQIRMDRNNQPVVNFSVCTETRDAQGNTVSKEWHRMVAFNGTAKRCAALLRKGRQVRVIGKVIYTPYQRSVHDINGNMVVINEPVARILVMHIDFMGNCYDVNFSNRNRNSRPFENRGVNQNNGDQRNNFRYGNNQNVKGPQYPETDAHFDSFVQDDGGRYPDEPGFGNGGTGDDYLNNW